MRKRYETIDLNFEHYFFKGAVTMERFRDAITLPRKVQRWEVNFLPGAERPYTVVTRDETEQERDERLEEDA